MNKGFSLAEVIIAAFITIIGIIGAMSLITYSISNVAVGRSQIIAASLAQEGMEVVRNIRDSNWIEDVDWNDGLTDSDCSGGCRVQYNGQSLVSFADTFLQINSSGLYGYNGVEGFSGGANTLFKRRIEITNVSAIEIKVVSWVTWNERSRSYEIKAESRLYNWK